jgi:hypothetical protein
MVLLEGEVAMQQRIETDSDTTTIQARAVSPSDISVKLSELLAEAARVSAERGVDLESFMKAAWSAYMDARPGLREHLETMQTVAQLTEMRRLGRVGQA